MINNFIQKIISAVILASFLCLPIHAVDYHVENQPEVIEQIVYIEQTGILKQKENGYLYVDVSNEFITSSIPLINVPGTIKPPSHLTSKKGIGAHISVIYENELLENDIGEIEELGQQYSFSVMEVRTVKMNINKKIKKLWLIAVAAPDLAQLREKYGLSPYLKGHDFHITLGTQTQEVAERINQAAFIISVEEQEIPEAA